MFFNCCRRCCCRQGGNQEKNCYDKYDYDKCDKSHNKCDYRDDRYDKCDLEKKEKCSCRINYEKKCCWDNDNHDEKSSSCSKQNNRFEGQCYYGEYNNLGYFNQQNSCDSDKDDNHKHYQKEETCYTPNWDCDKECKCEKDKIDKCDKHESDKSCKPVKYICIPFDKF